MAPTPLLPIFLRVEGRDCLVVGGGRVAARKLHSLARAGARITLIAPELDEKLAHELGTLGVTHIARPFRDEDLAGQGLVVGDDRSRRSSALSPSLVVAATDSVAVNEHIAALARARGIPVNVVNRPQAGTFMFPSVVDRDPITIAISTGGRSPALARWLKSQLEVMVPNRLGELADLISRFRDRVKHKYPSLEQRRRFWEQTLHGPLSEFLFHNRSHKAAEILERRLALDPNRTPVGAVHLVGAGPGDPDLLTFRALRLIQQADTILYDRLVNPSILDLAPDDAELIYVGKARADHSISQEQINRRLVDYALRGRQVVRLKGGDPFIFGRGGEEIDGLARQGIPFQVVPGITAASGCAAYAGIPLTHRDHAQSCIFVTGHSRNGTLDINWDALLQPRQTIVVYMGLTGLDILCRELVKRGMTGSTPAALIERGTTPEQRVIAATLAELPSAVENDPPRPPTLLIVGDVVKLKDTLSWFEG